ncbi:F0F1 ATP synthase subunit B [Propionibacterium australiense]|uniref:ATP synthase subunit b n=1 Tax=Propionibacterium australiense TaxID=119981 RepID=A0A383S2X0_9ACTN|nr:F0F1 ATP synthase subunit B [Propionibacterium australiense]RLP11646.1 F0F1 ATP synthase subunit B [Propionibacterium australiense]RLP12159.1 F0F1 ATP synthase subunit B [Propionibacterium australiense]SYZ32378.1 ATP synthase, F0 complex, subunit b, bacterial [Propionibacterium australiense]VEH90333.1 F-type ATPase subunit b [Propionibacterium australiense]
MTPFELVPLLDLGPLLPELPEFLAGLALLALMWLIMAKMVAPRFEELYERRANEIEGGIRHAERVQAEADAAKAEYQRQLEQVRAESSRARDEAREQGEQIIAEAKERAAQEQARMIAEARAQIAVEREIAMSELRSQVGVLATTLAGRILSESLSDDERARHTVDRFLAELETQPVRAQDAGE